MFPRRRSVPFVRAIALFLVVSLTLARTASAQDAGLSLIAGVESLGGCAGEELAVMVQLTNPSVASVTGYQAFVSYPAEIFEPVRFESLAVDAFVATAGARPFGSGFADCTITVSDLWDDGSLDDVVAVIGSSFGELGGQPFESDAVDVGRLVFRVRGAMSGEASFAFNSESCHPPIDQVSKVFGADGLALNTSLSSPSIVTVADAGAQIEAVTCIDRDATVELQWLIPDGGAVRGSVIYRDGERLASFPIPSVQSFIDETPPAGDIVYEVAPLLDGGSEGCRVRCVVSRTGPVFLRGDANDDNDVNISDAIAVLDHLFVANVTIDCEDAGDFDDSGSVDISDPISILNFLFEPGEKDPVPAPFPTAGVDPTEDSLTCNR